MGFDVGAVRAAYPALADGYAYLDGAAGTQVPASVIQAIAAAYARRPGQLRRRVPGQRAVATRSPPVPRARSPR